MNQNEINNLLTDIVIDDVETLQRLLEDTCVIGGVTRLISFDNKDGYVTIRTLNQECNEVRIQFRTELFSSAKLGGRNRHGKQVVYVSQAELLTIQIELKKNEDDELVLFEAIIDPDKIGNIVEFIR